LRVALRLSLGELETVHRLCSRERETTRNKEGEIFPISLRRSARLSVNCGRLPNRICSSLFLACLLAAFMQPRAPFRPSLWRKERPRVSLFTHLLLSTSTATTKPTRTGCADARVTPTRVERHSEPALAEFTHVAAGLCSALCARARAALPPGPTRVGNYQQCRGAR